ncbi:hypothetical protein SDC9_183999 [bioreactor metagenome]|uniref:DUF4364 domain-containing protein n=1 Tax=bioreactor metagenome TaxID=1076179 RepID=A0A645HCN9_9ZZZZ
MCDEGVDYFQFAEAVADLVSTEHLTLADGHYAITEKGRKNGGICESSLPYSVRAKCDRSLAALNAGLRRRAQVRSQILPREDGALTLKLELDDEGGNLLTLELLTASREQAQELGRRFQERPEQIYNRVLDALLSE